MTENLSKTAFSLVQIGPWSNYCQLVVKSWAGDSSHSERGDILSKNNIINNDELRCLAKTLNLHVYALSER